MEAFKMADFLDIVGAIGNGPIPRMAAMMSQQNKQKQINDAVMEAIAQGLTGQSGQPSAQPTNQPTTVRQAFPEYKQQVLNNQGFGLDDYIAQNMPTNGNQAAQPSLLGLGTGLHQYPTSRNASMYQQPAQPTLQPIQPTPQPQDNSAMLQQVRALAGKGLNPMAALQLVSGISSTRKSQEKDAAAKQQAPGLYGQLYQRMTADDRPGAMIIALQLKQLGLEIPVGYLQWAGIPEKKMFQSNLGDQVVVGSFDPKSGSASVSQAFRMGARPMNEFEQYRIDNGLVGRRGGGGNGGGNGGGEKFDPSSAATATGKYRQAVNAIIKNQDDSYKTKAEIEMELGNGNVRRQLALYAAAAGIDPAQVENDIAYIRETLKTIN
jgi:hypothetical protein